MESGAKAPDPPRLVLIGCGAIARSFHLPAIAKRSGLAGRMVLADPALDRARRLGEEFGAGRAVADFREVLGEVSGAIITTPAQHHFAIARECLRAGVPVLCEKPLAASAFEAAELVKEAERREVALAVNNTRRLVPVSGRIREMIRGGAIGEPTGLTFDEGDRFDWPMATGAVFGRGGTGRGVLQDMGAHVLDLVCWWLGGRPQLDRYEDDSYGGSEAVAQVDLSLGRCRVEVGLSWLAKLPNRFRIVGEEGVIEAGIYDWRSLRYTSASGSSRRVVIDSPVNSYSDLAPLLLDDFLEVVERGHAPLVPAAEVLPSLELIEECYARRSRLPMPWHDTLDRIAYAHA